MSLEVEVKFPVVSFDTIRQALTRAGGERVRARTFEHNVRYDTADERLHAAWQMLRLREDDRVRLTFKGPDPAGLMAETEVRVREELEVEVSDFATADRLIRRLGFIPLQSYEKYRETWHLGSVEVVLDELPFGRFVELEGVAEALAPAADQLGLAWSQRILTNYLALFAEKQAQFGLPFNDLTFANFADIDTTAWWPDAASS